MSDFEECLKKCMDENERIIRQLRSLKTEMEDHHTACNTAKTIGTSAGAAGTGIFVASLVAAPFTGGISLLGAVSGLALTVGGGATNIVTDVVDSNKTKDIIKTINEMVENKQKLSDDLQKYFDIIRDLEQKMVNTVSREEALVAIFRGFANRSFGNSNMIGGTIDLSVVSILTKLAQLSVAEKLVLKSGNMAITSVEMATPFVGKGVQALGLGGKLGANAAKIFGRVAAGVAITMTVIDIALMIRDWTRNHPTIEVIDDLIKKIKEENESLKEIYSIIDDLKERVYYSVIEGIPIVGASEIFIEATIHLLNNERQKCEDFLKSIIEVKVPENIGQFLTKDADAMINFNEQEIRDFLKIRGKKGGKLVQEYLDNVEAVLEEFERKGVDKKIRSDQGEHVINKSVINVYKDIIDDFVWKVYRAKFNNLSRIPETSTVRRDYDSPLPQDIINNIRNVMIAKIPANVSYIDANAVIYGMVIKTIRQSVNLHMVSIFHHPNIRSTGSDHSAKIKAAVFKLNDSRIYVDKSALKYWLAHGGDRHTFDKSYAAVRQMFHDLYDKTRTWVSEMKNYYPDEMDLENYSD